MPKSLHFLYHEIRPSAAAYAYVTPLAEFEAHCALFARVRREPNAQDVSPEVTFDDGHHSDVEYALPALNDHGLRATFFITAGWTNERPGFMGWSDVRRIVAAGHEVGAHGLTHKLLTACSTAELGNELVGARQRLEDNLGLAVSAMSLPGGRANQRVLKACTEAGYTRVFTSVPRAEDMGQKPCTVGRLNLLGGTRTEWLERVLDSRTGLLKSLERKQRFKAGAQRVLGDRIYGKVWAMANRQEAESQNESGTKQGRTA